MIEKDNVLLKFQGFTAAKRPVTGISLIYDIEGFTNFFNKPGLEQYITDYLNHITECVETIIYGGDQYWVTREGARDITDDIKKPVLRKFLGDGMLYVWEITDEDNEKLPYFRAALALSLLEFQVNFNHVTNRLKRILPTSDLPRKVRFGIAEGTIYRLETQGSGYDYIGPSINLASRLVKYCAGINLIWSSRFHIGQTILDVGNFNRVVALQLRSFEKENVYVMKHEYNMLKEDVCSEKFELIL